MSVVVSVNLADGVILGVDSATQLPGPPPDIASLYPLLAEYWQGGPLKIYEGAEKLFPLDNRPIGVAIYGTPVIGNRSVANHLREFVLKDPNGVISGETSVEQVAEGIRQFFAHLYETVVKPSISDFRHMPFEQIPEAEWPGFGFVIGGYSAKAYSSEVWLVFVPTNPAPSCMRAQGDASVNWYGNYGPIERYLLGFPQRLKDDLLQHFEKVRGLPFADAEREPLNGIFAKYSYPLAVSAMPVSVGVEFTRFLVDLVINHHRFNIGPAYVAGSARIGKATYSSDTFEILK